ncbi:unnamed protein product, partial [Choristocarpus tenellus]
DATPNSVEEITGSKEAPISQTGVNGGNGESGKRSGGSGRGPLTWGAVGLLGIAGVALGQYYQSEKEKQKSLVVSQVNSTGKPALGGPWTLVDINGCPKTDKDYHGQYVLLYFGFAHCPDICPSELVKVGAIAQKIEASLGPGTLKPVFVSVDPDRDSLRQLRHYAQDFHQSIEYLTGTKEQVARAAKSYRVYFSKTDEHEEGEDYLVDHSIVLYLLAPDGEFLDFFTQRTTVSDLHGVTAYSPSWYSVVDNKIILASPLNILYGGITEEAYMFCCTYVQADSHVSAACNQHGTVVLHKIRCIF